MTRTYNRSKTSNYDRRGACQSNIYRGEGLDVQHTSHTPKPLSLLSLLLWFPSKDSWVFFSLEILQFSLRRSLIEGCGVKDQEVFEDPSCSCERVSQQGKQSTSRLEHSWSPKVNLHFLFCRFSWLLVVVIFYILDSVYSDLDT